MNSSSKDSEHLQKVICLDLLVFEADKVFITLPEIK